MNICEYCDNEFEGEAYACPKDGCETVVFCGEQCQIEHMNEEHGED